MHPRKKREMVLQLLHAIEGGESRAEDLVPLLMEELAVSKKTVREAHERALSVWEEHVSQDALIGETADSFSLERIGRVERNILRLALFELQEAKEPAKVVIAEAIRLARKFATPEAANFVNAIVDHASLSTRKELSA